MKPDPFMAWFPIIMRYGALAGVAYETLIEKFDRPALLTLFGMMLGLGEITNAINRRNSGGGDKDEK